MDRHKCRECGDPIPNGHAHFRSENFRQVYLLVLGKT